MSEGDVCSSFSTGGGEGSRPCIVFRTRAAGWCCRRSLAVCFFLTSMNPADDAVHLCAALRVPPSLPWPWLRRRAQAQGTRRPSPSLPSARPRRRRERNTKGALSARSGRCGCCWRRDERPRNTRRRRLARAVIRPLQVASSKLLLEALFQ